MEPYECRYYRRLENGRVECLLCPHHCRIAEGKTGVCKSRRNQGGVLVSDVYGKPEQVECYDLSPQSVVSLCEKHHQPGIAYTYTEPLTYIEYVMDTARLAHEKGIWNILVTAGYVCKEPLADLLPYIDAANVDLKSFSDDIYQRVSGGHLSTVLETIISMRDAGVWIELTNLIIPGVNDDMDMIRRMCRWMKENGLANAPLHFSRFFPRYKMENIPPTPLRTLQAAKQIAHAEGIQNVYLGNV